MRFDADAGSGDVDIRGELLCSAFVLDVPGVGVLEAGGEAGGDCVSGIFLPLFSSILLISLSKISTNLCRFF